MLVFLLVKSRVFSIQFGNVWYLLRVRGGLVVLTISLKRLVSSLISLLLALGAIVFAGNASPATAAGLASCADIAGQTSNVTVSASHGQVFYIDSAAGQNLDAAYVGYKVVAAAAKTNLWVKLDTFKGGVIGLSNPSDASYSLGDLSSGNTKTAFFLLKALSTSIASQTHTIHIYSGKPGLSGSTEIRSCTFSFLKVRETIKANPNKVSAVTTTPADTSGMVLGSTFTVKVVGDTGTIGAGSSPDLDMIWLSPSSKSNWPTSALRLESSVIKFDTVANQVAACTTEALCQFTNQLLITSLLTKATAIKANAKSLAYEATYTFRVIGTTGAVVPILPVSQISSGTQVKHTPIPLTALASIGVDSVTVNAAVTKSVEATSVILDSNTEYSYKVTVSNSGSSSITLDQIMDTPALNLNYVALSSSLKTFNVASGGSAVSTVTPPEPSNDVGTSNQVFVGPFAIPALGRVELTYRMSIPTCSSESYSYTNSAVAKLGAITIGSGATTFSNTTAAGVCGNTSVTVTTTDVVLPVEVATFPATSLGNTTASVNGIVDPNGQSGQNILFTYGTNSNLDGATSVITGTTTSGSSPYAAAQGLTDLSSGTVYYFRISVGSVRGEILSFATTEPVSTPLVTTDTPTNVTQTGGTLNATIDPNQTTSYVSFTYSKSSSDLTSGTYVTRIRDDQAVAFNSTSNPYTALSSSFSTQIQLATSDLAFTEQNLTLANGNTLYYRANYTDAAGSIISSGVIKSFVLRSNLTQTITFNEIADVLLSADPLTASPSTDAPGLNVQLASTTTAICSVSGYVVTYLAAGNCTLQTDQDGGQGSDLEYYSAADPVVQSFIISRNSRTLSMPTFGSYTWSDSTPSPTSTASADDSDAKSYTTITSGTDDAAKTDVCEYVSGALTFKKPGDCWVQGTVQQGNRYNSASTKTNITVTTREQRLLINSGTDKTVGLSEGSTSMAAISDADSNTSGLGANTYALDSSLTSTSGCAVDSASGVATFTQAGTCYVHATKSGNTWWENGATTGKLTVNSKQNRTLTLSSGVTGSPLWGTDVSSVTSTASSDNSDEKTYSTITSDTDDAAKIDVCEFVAGKLTFKKPGDCWIKGTIAEGSSYNSATDKVKITVAKKDQTLSFNDKNVVISSGLSTSMLVSTDATTNSSGVISEYKVEILDNTAGCTVDASSGLVTFTQVGKCTITADVTGNNFWNARTVSKKLNIAAAQLTSPSPTPSASPTTVSTNTRPTPKPSTPKPIVTAPSPIPYLKATPIPKANLPIPTASSPVETSQNTMDLGGGVQKADSNIGTFGANYNSTAQRTIGKFTDEKIIGFAASVGIRIEVIGARTVGQFIVVPGTTADPIAVAEALEESRNRTATNFASITRVQSIGTPSNDKIIGGKSSLDAIGVFASSGLENPITVGELNLTPNSKWLKIDAFVNMYKPGTVVYLAVTTQPVIFGAAIVDKSGKANFSGFLPIDVLEPGGHNIRIVGVRLLDGISSDENGEIRVANSTLSEIQRFDEGTEATIKISGANITGGSHLAIRVIPILKITPWWTIWLTAGSLLLLIVALRTRKVTTKSQKRIASFLMVASTIPALTLGWTAASYSIMGLGGVFLILDLLVVRIYSPAKSKPAHLAS